MGNKLLNITTQTYSKAQILKSRFEAEGIECFLENLDHPELTIEVKLMVNEEDGEKALRIIKAFEEENEAKSILQRERIKEIKRILVPIDFSDYSENACHFALGLAAKYHAHLKLLHSYFYPGLAAMPFEETYTYNDSMTTYLNDMQIKAEKDLQRYKKALLDVIEKEKIEGVTVDYTLDRGFIEDSVISLSESFHPDLIVAGAVRKDERNRFAIGNLPVKIIEKTKIPLLLIPADTRFDGLDKIKNLMYATDFDESDFITIKRLMKFVEIINIKVHCVHVGSDSKNPWNIVRMESLKEYFLKMYGKVNIDTALIENEDIVNGMLDFIHKNNIDVLALTTHKRNLITKIISPSIAKKMLFETHIPLLIFHS